jgi:hypothetical protein
MKLALVALIAILGPSLVSSQEQESAEIAKLEFVEKMYAGGAEHFRKALADRGLTDAEVEGMLFKAIDKYSECAVRAAQAQAREQGLPEDVVLKGVGGGTRGKEEARILLELDMDAMKKKREPCRKELGETLGVTIQ